MHCKTATTFGITTNFLNCPIAGLDRWLTIAEEQASNLSQKVLGQPATTPKALTQSRLGIICRTEYVFNGRSFRAILLFPETCQLTMKPLLEYVVVDEDFICRENFHLRSELCN